LPALPAFLVRHKGLKILSLFLAVTLWFAVGGEERTEVTLSVPLELTNLSSDLVVTSEIPSALQVRIMGPRGLIRSLAQGRLVHTLDLAGFKAGRHSFPLGPHAFSLPRGVVVSRVQPNPLVLTLATTLTRTLPVKPVVSGAPPEGYELKELVVTPAHVTVQGPASELDKLTFIPTLPIILNNLSSSTTLASDLDFKSLHLTLKTPAPIMARITIAPKTMKKTFSGLAVTPSPQNARLQPAKVAVTLEGPWPLFKEFKPEALKISVDTKNLKPGHHRLPVQVTLSSNLTLIKIDPPTLTAVIGKPRN